MVQAAQESHACDLARAWPLVAIEECRHALRDTSPAQYIRDWVVWTRAVVVAYIFRNDTLQVLAVQHQHVVQAFAAQAADGAFAERVRSGGLIWGEKFIDASMGNEVRELAAILAVTIVDKIIGMLIPSCRAESARLGGFAQLLCSPGVGGCGRHVSMHNTCRVPSAVRTRLRGSTRCGVSAVQ